MYATETTQASATLLNQRFISMLGSGQTKQAEDAGTAFIRSIVRQEAAVRLVLPPQQLQNDELDRDVDSDEPRKIVEKEPDSSATYVQFDGTPRARWFRGKRYVVFFGKTQSDLFTKSKFKLMTQQYDIRKLLADNAVKDMADQEDIYFRRTCLTLVNRAAASQRTPAGAFTAAPFVKGFQAMDKRRRPIGKMLLTNSLFREAMNLPATLIGESIVRKTFEEGTEKMEKLWGIPAITTAKTDVYHPDECWIFAPQNYLGNFFLLQDATLFIEQRADIITFFAYAAPGIGIGNSEAMQQIVFNTAPNA
jgi:hypothetical protein